MAGFLKGLSKRHGALRHVAGTPFGEEGEGEARAKSSAGGKKKVLIADDERQVRLLISNMLRKDYAVIEATDGKEAVDLTRSQKPDLILMDIMMPGMDGYTACHVLKSAPATKAIPVLMITGVGHELNRKLSEEMGADGYVTKPFDYQALLDKIRSLL